METLATYLIKSSVWLTGFALVYALFLRNERFFVLNRIYLVSGILGSILFPLFTWHYTVVLPVVPSVEVSNPSAIGIVTPDESFSTQNMLLIGYLSGIAYILYRLLRQTLPVFRIIRKSERNPYRSAKLIRTDAYPASFSFFSFVFVNPSIPDTETNEIVNHELEHIRQQHWIDLLLFEILRLMQWFNPAVWFYGHLIRQNHEYLADERALQRSSNPAVYRAALLNQLFGGPVISLANSFNYSLNKKRFIMMKHTIKSPFRKLKLLLVLPLIAGIFYAFAAPEYVFQNKADSGKETVSQETKTIKGKVSDESGKPLKSASVVVLGKPIGTITNDDGRFILKVTDDSPIMISYVGFETLKINPDFSLEMAITLKTKTFTLEIDTPTAEAGKNEQINLNESKALVMVDGKEISKAELDKIHPDKIESVSVLKGETATKLYGEKGKDGVVLVTLKSGNQNSETYKVMADNPLKFVTADGSGKEPLYLKDWVIVESKDVQNLDPETIESINVLKDKSATAVYGEKGKNGVVQITMKKDKAATKNEPIVVTGYKIDATAKQVDQPTAAVQIRGTGTLENASKPLVVVDGVISENQDLSKIDPGTIESVNVLKNEASTAKYGEKGKNGVVEIKLKPQTGVFTMVEELPEFPGGPDAINTFIKANVQYPEKAIESGISGKVFVNFMVTKTGKVENVKVIRSLQPLLDAEAVRVIKLMPDWKPGTQNGEKVDVKYSLQVSFSNPKSK
jgi:TonB family protein